jgi:hypothetical protein
MSLMPRRCEKLILLRFIPHHHLRALPLAHGYSR